TWLTIGNETVAEIMCMSDYDWIAIDLEHSSIDLSMTLNLIRVIELSGKSSLVRVSSNDEVQIKRVLEAGASGIIVPMIRNREDVERAYSYMHYPPYGKRGVGLARAQGYGTRFRDYL